MQMPRDDCGGSLDTWSGDRGCRRRELERGLSGHAAVGLPVVNPCRLHITGASGAGTTTLGRAVATRWAVPHADVDDYFWVPTTPPYTTKRDEAQRLRLLHEVFVGRDTWVLSGTLMAWGDALVESFDAVVFLTLDDGERMERLHAREVTRYGSRIEPGGPQEAAHRDFMDWAAGYEDPDFDGRNRAIHEEWLAALPCPVLRLDSTRPVEELVAEIAATPDATR